LDLTDIRELKKMQVLMTFTSVEHYLAVKAYADRTATPGQHVDIPVKQTAAGNGAQPQPVATYTGPLHTASAATQGNPAPVDGAGVPWNGDFHASTKTQTLKGFWKARKGRDEAAAAAYTAQFGAPTAGVALAAPAVTYPVPGAATAFSFGAPAGPSPVGCTPQEFMTMANHLMSQGKMDNASIMQICQEIGVTDPNTLQVDDIARAQIYGRMMAISAG